MPFIGVQLAPFGNGKTTPSGVTYAELRDAQLLRHQGAAEGRHRRHHRRRQRDRHPPAAEGAGRRAAGAAAPGAGLRREDRVPRPGLQGRRSSTPARRPSPSTTSAAGWWRRTATSTGFTVAGKDGVFHPAKAEIKGDTVVVSSEQVPNPAAVRYGWVNFAKPTLNLFNKEGLPATPVPHRRLPADHQAQPKKSDRC